MNIINTIKRCRLKLYLEWFRHKPLQNNKIILWTSGFKSYGCSPKYITEHLISHFPGKYDIVWVFDSNVRLTDTLPKGVRYVRYFSLDYLQELSTAKFIICNARTGPGHFFEKRAGQIYIQTWHSSLRLKKIEGDAADTLPQSYIDAAKADSAKIDLLLSGCEFSTEIFKRAFWYNGKILKCGTPRCDILQNDTDEIRRKVFRTYALPLDTKLVLYAPTFRDNKIVQTHGLDFEILKHALERRTGTSWVVGCRFHPNLTADTQPQNCISMTSYPDMQELLAAADCLITDYSSCMFDMAIAGKPCILYAPDLEDYCSNERGLYFDIENLPFPKCMTMDELYQCILTIDIQEHKKKSKIFLKSIGSYEDGLASQRIANYIEERTKG